MKKYFFIAMIALIGCAEKDQKGEVQTAKDTAPVQELEVAEDLTIAFYNVENLFDTKDDPQTRDNDFLPEGSYKWTEERYQQKLSNLAKVIGQLDEGNAPEVIGLCEIENRGVLEDLVKTESLKSAEYAIAHANSPDRRGIDVALLYQPNYFQPYSIKDVEINMPAEPDMRTRDILLVSGKVAGEDTIHFIVNHFPSRRGGKAESEPKRVYVAQQVRKLVDSLTAQSADAKIVIMGDFNDTPMDKSIRETLMANGDQKSLQQGELYNTMYQMASEGKGTYNFRGNWDMLDQMIISQALLQENGGYHYQENSAMIFERDWLKQQEGKYIGYPDRTYGGRKYLGGYSDHFPVKVELVQ